MLQNAIKLGINIALGTDQFPFEPNGGTTATVAEAELYVKAGMTPLQAIVTAGGLTQFANSKRIYILRNTGGKQQKIPFNYKQALKGDSKQDVSLQPGDTIVVP